MVLANQASVLKKVIVDGFSNKIKTRERIAIHKYVDQKKQELMEGLQNSSNASQVTKNDFAGLTLQPGTSSNTANTITYD